MPRQELTVTAAAGPWAAVGAEFAWQAEDGTNHSQFTSTGKELLLAYNASVDTAYTVTVSSVADEMGRTADVSEEIPFGEMRAFGPFERAGWMQEDGKVYCASTNADLKFAVIRLP